MGLTRFPINRPVTITMFILALVLMGSIAYTRLPVSRYPNLFGGNAHATAPAT